MAFRPSCRRRARPSTKCLPSVVGIGTGTGRTTAPPPATRDDMGKTVKREQLKKNKTRRPKKTSPADRFK
jgi:hypothetical protein